MVVIHKENGMVEVQSRTGEMIELDHGTYNFAKGLMELYKRTSPEILKMAGRYFAADPEQRLETRLVRESIEFYLARGHFLKHARHEI